jgi:hypothetical protein
MHLNVLNRPAENSGGLHREEESLVLRYEVGVQREFLRRGVKNQIKYLRLHIIS